MIGIAQFIFIAGAWSGGDRMTTAANPKPLQERLELARKFLENHGYRVTRIAEMSQLELSKRDAREQGIIFDKELYE